MRGDVISLIEPIRAPLVNVLRYIVKSESVGWSLPNSLGSIQPKLRIIWLKPRSFIAPGVELAFESAARDSFPLGFGWKSIDPGGFLSQPSTVSSCVEPTDGRDRLIGMIETRVGPAWRRFVTGVFDEELIELIREGEASDREFVNEDSVNGAFVGCARIATHQELSGRNNDHFWFDVHRVDVRRKKCAAK